MKQLLSNSVLDAEAIIPPPIPADFDESSLAKTRIAIGIPVLLKGMDIAGNFFLDQTRTVLISQRGAKILTRHSMAVGVNVELVIPAADKKSSATISWVGKKIGDQHEVGITLDEPDGFWGVKFPNPEPTSTATSMSPAFEPSEPSVPLSIAPVDDQNALRSPAPPPALLAVPQDLAERLKAELDEDLGGIPEEPIETSRLCAFNIFAGLNDHELIQAAECCKCLEIKKDTQIILEGQVGKDIYLMERGTVAISRRDKNSSRLLATLQAPVMFGEMAVVNRERIRTATVTATADVAVLVVPIARFVELLNASPVLKRNLLNLIARRS